MILQQNDQVVLAAALARVAEGDRKAFEEVYRGTSAKLFAVCLRILPVRQEAEEVLQEAFIAVWQRAGQFNGSRGTAMTWLITLTRNRAVDRLRANGRPIQSRIDIADVAPAPTASAQAGLEAHEDNKRLAQCMEELQPAEALFIRTSFFEGSTYAELSSRTGLPLGTVKSRVRRALLKLRTCLQ